MGHRPFADLKVQVARSYHLLLSKFNESFYLQSSPDQHMNGSSSSFAEEGNVGQESGQLNDFHHCHHDTGLWDSTKTTSPTDSVLFTLCFLLCLLTLPIFWLGDTFTHPGTHSCLYSKGEVDNNIKNLFNRAEPIRTIFSPLIEHLVILIGTTPVVSQII